MWEAWFKLSYMKTVRHVLDATCTTCSRSHSGGPWDRLHALQEDLSHLASPESGVSSRQASGSRASGSRRSLRRNESRRDQPSGYAAAHKQEEEEQPKRLSGWAKLRMARRMQGNVKAIQVMLSHQLTCPLPCIRSRPGVLWASGASGGLCNCTCHCKCLFGGRWVM